MDNTQNIISFCSGYGGIELGIKRTGLPIRTVCYVEIETFAQANLVAKIEQGKMDAAPIWSNLKTFDGRPFRGKVHGIIGGYPCQPFSNAGQRKGTEDPRHLFPYICEHIRTVRPLWCFFENVGGHLNLGFDEVYKSLRDLGYQVEAGLFTAAEVGGPHKRERLFILAYSESERSLREPGTIQQENGRQGRPLLREPNRSSNVEIASGKRTRGVSGQVEGSNRSSVLRQGNGEACTGGATAAGELADSEMPEREQSRGTRTGRQGLTDYSTKLAQSNGSRSPEDRQQCELRTNSTEQPPSDTGKCKARQERQGRWPARPGQQQYDWEEPRTVKSGMGRTVDGFASRVDELRLLGNGVVPQTAELAFRTLWNKTSGVIEEIKK